MPAIQDDTRWQQIALFLFTLAILVVCALIIHPFFSALLGATVLAVITQRPYDWLATKVPNRNLCAASAMLVVVLAVIVPSFYLSEDIVEQAIAAVTALRNDTTQVKITGFFLRHPAIADRVQAFTDSIDLNNVARVAAAYVGSHLGAIVGTSARLITQILVMLFILFFLFRDRAVALRYLHSLLPLREDERTELLHRLDDTIYATALGRLAIAAIQGIFAGLGYWALGVPGVFLWAFCTALLSLIPAFGAILVWAPIALYLGFTGHWGKAAILAVWGGVIVSTIDNFLYPIFVGTRLRAHTVTILISILGGIALFGITGVVLGPVAFTLAATLLDFWRSRTET